MGSVSVTIQLLYSLAETWSYYVNHATLYKAAINKTETGLFAHVVFYFLSPP
jgi:hypothetical protein